jgi:hypothetical protein
MADSSDSESTSSSETDLSSPSDDCEFSENSEVFQGIQPWRFEPPGHSDQHSEDENDEDSQAGNRLQIFDW